jgi:hypothetical protein
VSDSIPNTGEIYRATISSLFDPEQHELMDFTFRRTFDEGKPRAVIQMTARHKATGARFVIRFDDVKTKDFPILDQTVDLIVRNHGFGWADRSSVFSVELPCDGYVLFHAAAVSVSSVDSKT